MITSFLFAIFGNRFLDPDTPGLTRESDFSNLAEATQCIYFLSTLSNYPAALLPYVKYDKTNLMFFYPFLVFTVLIILPLPVAVIFEAFKINRGKILLRDRINEKEGLFIAFLCIDYERRGYINLDQWARFINKIYKGNQDDKKVKRVFESLDDRDTGYMNCEKFFQGCELIKSLQNLTTSSAKPNMVERARQYIMRYIKLDVMVKSKWFDGFMLIVIILNMGLLVLQL